jgi:hypothetical protein
MLSRRGPRVRAVPADRCVSAAGKTALTNGILRGCCSLRYPARRGGDERSRGRAGRDPHGGQSGDEGGRRHPPQDRGRIILASTRDAAVADAFRPLPSGRWRSRRISNEWSEQSRAGGMSETPPGPVVAFGWEVAHRGPG